MAGYKSNWTEVPKGWEDPLTYAITTRDANLLETVAHASEAGEVALAYQPILRADTGQIAFYEGLLRIFDPAGRIIPSREFINQTEGLELGRILDCQSLEIGLAALKDTPGLRLSVNMSARSIGYPNWMLTLQRGLEADPTVAERLILEISERSAMHVPELVTYFMRDLQARGVSFALDDFGSGYTSFRYLKDFYFDILKIDDSFTRGIAETPDNQVLVKALLVIAQQLDMFTVAKGVEREEDAAWMAENDIEYLQGFYFAAPTLYPPWAKSNS